MKAWPLLALLLAAPGGAQVLNPAVTQATIGDTICKPGWAASVRPSTSYTGKVKRRLFRSALEAGEVRDGEDIDDFELDHNAPLVLGGHPRSLDNLRLQRWEGPDGAFAKDAVERRMRDMVCRGQIDLLRAQVCMVTDWKACSGNPKGGDPIVKERTE